MEKRRRKANKFTTFMHNKYPNAICCNCGSVPVEWHHVVPVFQGGNDIESAVVPLCSKCHKATHGNREVWNYNAGVRGGRRAIHLTDERFSLMLRYVNGEIGATEMCELSGITDRKSLCPSSKAIWVQEFKEKSGITNWHNAVDVKLAKTDKGGRGDRTVII